MSGGAAPTAHRKQYMAIFAVLFIATVLEIGVVEIGLGKAALISALVGLAVGKAWLVMYYFMHLNHETKIMKWTVYIPFVFPALYAVVLIADGWWRMAKVG